MNNVNPRTGIRYGVIACNSLDSDLVEELMHGAGATEVHDVRCLSWNKLVFQVVDNKLEEPFDHHLQQAHARLPLEVPA